MEVLLDYNYSRKLELQFIFKVYDYIDECISDQLWSIVGSFKLYLYNYNQEFLDEFHYRITDGENPDVIMKDISIKLNKDICLSLMMDELEKIND